MAHAGSLHEDDERGCSVEACVLACGRNRHDIDIARQNGPALRARSCDRQHAGAGADVEDRTNPAPWLLSLGEAIECQEAAARGAVMAGAEGKCGFDLDADAIERYAQPIMPTMYDES